jgi:hypothetical protein
MLLGPKVTINAEAGQPNSTAKDEEDLRSYREAIIRAPFHPFFGDDKGLAQAQQ